MNQPRWKLVVEGLGKIERAEVEVRPLMLFVGDNNSGKSYLASVLWGLLAMRRELPLPAGPTLSACEAWLEARLAASEHPAKYPTSDEECSLFTRLFNEMIGQEHALARWVFNNSAMTAARIEVEPVRDHADRVPASVEPSPIAPWAKQIPRDWQLRAIASQTALGLSINQPPIFLPASRSGFMLLYHTAARRGFEQAVVSESTGGLKMTRPVYQFIDLLAFGMQNGEGPYAAEADLLESGIDGRVERLSGPVGINEYAYRPAGAASALDLSLVSSLVTELAPVVLVLRHLSGFPVLVLEEPEAHLHPKLQRKLAQVVVRLIRKGLFVWITTHSENFCQQINDFMKIGVVSDRDRLRAEMQKSLGYAYGEQDYLTPEDVAGYELVNAGERSIVRPLDKHPDGLVMPTFNREMVALGREVTFLERKLDEGV